MRLEEKNLTIEFFIKVSIISIKYIFRPLHLAEVYLYLLTSKYFYTKIIRHGGKNAKKFTNSPYRILYNN